MADITQIQQEINKLFCSKIAMHKLDLSNTAICVVNLKLDPIKFNYFDAKCVLH